jgi:hypothetical protein
MKAILKIATATSSPRPRLREEARQIRLNVAALWASEFKELRRIPTRQVSIELFK